jgi:hypothetical protein
MGTKYIEETNTYYNNGNVTTEKNTKKQKTTYSREPDYIKLYIDDISKLNGISAGQSSFMYELLKYVGYGNKLYINAGI